MTEETTKEIETQNTEAASSEAPEQDLGNGVGASIALVSEGNGTIAGEILDAHAPSASTAAGEGNDAAPAAADAVSEAGLATGALAAGATALAAGAGQVGANIPTIGGSTSTEPLTIGVVTIQRSRFDGQFLIKSETGEGFSAPNASAAGQVAATLVSSIVQESINGKFEYAAGAA